MTRLRTWMLAFWRWLRWLFGHPRYQVMAVVVLVSFVLKDRLFPFSSFPMYGDFPDRTDYVYLADKDGQPMPMHDYFGYRTTFVKRIYSRQVRDIYQQLKKAGEEPELHLLTVEQLRPAGDATLRWLVENDRRRKQKKEPVPPLQLVEVDVEIGDHRLERRPRVVGLYPGEPR